MNKVILAGNIASDIECRTTQSGLQTASFRIAVRRRFKNVDGTYDSDFISVVCWRNTAEFVQKYFSKGQSCIVEGAIQTRSYEKDGQKRYITEVVADNVEFAGKRENGGTAPAPVNNNQGGFTNVDDYDVPF